MYKKKKRAKIVKKKPVFREESPGRMRGCLTAAFTVLLAGFLFLIIIAVWFRGVQ